MTRAALLALALAACASPNIQGDVPPALECAARITGYRIPAIRPFVEVKTPEEIERVGKRGVEASAEGARLAGYKVVSNQSVAVFATIGGQPVIHVPAGAAFTTLVHENVHFLQWANGRRINSPESEREAYHAETQIERIC